jgi:predicted ester cyclase
VPERRFDVLDLVAEGDAVAARFSYEMTNEGGKKISARGLTYFRLEGGRIVEDEPMSIPDMAASIGSLMPAPTTA